jgi:phospholipase C
MDGFVVSYREKAGAPNNGADVMKCFAPEQVPVISTLATQYCLFDQYFASLPGALPSSSGRGAKG